MQNLQPCLTRAGHRQERCCAVCEAPLPARPDSVARPDPYPTCHAVACRMVVSRRAEMGEHGFRHYLQYQVQEKRRQARRALADRTMLEAEAAENAVAWRALHRYAQLPATAGQDPLRLLLPSGPRRSSTLSARRRERYRAHLAAAALAALAMASAAAAPDPAPASPLPGRLCALCGGGCCTRGADHAYLGPATLRRFMDTAPQLSPAQVVEAYLDRLSGTTRAGSCINHTSAGCSLPRAMRSDTCNRYQCASLEKLAAQDEAEAVFPVLVIRRQRDQWHRGEAGPGNALIGAALLRETGVRHMPIRAKDCI
ncbi:hypothetical protein KY495_11595 [Massilia sp. PAMC28688]|uniref:hypothetical protein n=1 Tax=Massilia sp. PAMC28688 TaxID=2861283 RepID=UPI001C62FDF1|nr:hypothetical protein [Massilia sp. PAMC28688]QYF95734.1 hypothetical protein KY495_11595 [Massilia sp. PAMC28688]